jgi:hypothetical protein
MFSTTDMPHLRLIDSACRLLVAKSLPKHKRRMEENQLEKCRLMESVAISMQVLSKF